MTAAQTTLGADETARWRSEQLSGRVVVVTGGSRGIGLGLARGVARAGASVAVWARNASTGEAAADSLRGFGVAAEFVQCDVTVEESVDDAMAQTTARLGPVDALFANAGIVGGAERLTNPGTRQWREVMSANLDSVLFSFRAAARSMIADGRPGALVGVSSTGARLGTPGFAAYGASKSAVLSLCRSAAVELARFEIRCNALVPGYCKTDMMGEVDNLDFVAGIVDRVPAGRLGSPSDFEEVAMFLADPRLGFHTGDQVSVDGGYAVY